MFRSSYVRQFKKVKEELTAHLFKLYNDTVFDRKVSQRFTVKCLGYQVHPKNGLRTAIMIISANINEACTILMSYSPTCPPS